MTLLRRGTHFSWPRIILLTLLSGAILNVQAQNPQQEGGDEPKPPGPEPPKGPRWTLPPAVLQIEGDKVKLPDGAVIVPTKHPSFGEYSEIPGACSVKSSAANTITLTYDKKAAGGCSVYLVFEKEQADKGSIDFTAKTEQGCLPSCIKGKNDELEKSSLNSMPFIYSKTRSEIENQKLKDGPMQVDGECPDAVLGQPADDKTCIGKGGEYCMGETFLEIGWSKCGNKLHALVHPVGEPSAGVGLEEAAESIEVTIESDAKKWFTVGKTSYTYDSTKPEQGPFCVKPEKIVKPKYWSIEEPASAELKGKSILAFHLLPQTARRVHNWKEDTKTWAVMKKDDLDQELSAPACLGKFSITFKDVIGLLAVGDELPTTTPPETTTTMPSTTPNVTAEPTATPTNKTDDAAPAGGLGLVWIIVIIVASLALVAAVGVLIYCLCCRGKGEDDEEEAGEEEEDAEKGEAGDPKKEASGGDE